MPGALKRTTSVVQYSAKKARPTSHKSKRKSVATTVRRLLNKNSELKQGSTSFTTGNGSAVVQNTCLTIAQGDNFQNNRNGDAIMIKQIRLRYSINTAPGSVNGDVVRIMLVRDKQTNGALPTAASAYFDNSASFPFLADYNATMITKSGYSNNGRFTVLYDRIHALPMVSIFNAAGGVNQQTGGVTLNGNWKAQFIGTTNGIASIGEGNLILVMVAENNTNLSGTNVDVSVLYTDI